jgi:uncharacterized membrane protein HdeD (DUF308 family)
MIDAGTTSQVSRRAYLLFPTRGAVALALGILLLLAGFDLRRLTTVVAVYCIVAALLTLHWVGAHRTQPRQALGLLAGTIGLVAGIGVVLRPLLDALLSRGALLDILGASAITTGVLRLLGFTLLAAHEGASSLLRRLLPSTAGSGT